MGSPFTPREMRFLSTGLAGAGVMAVVGLAWWCGPLSPVVLDRPARLVAAGETEAAVDAYLQLADGWAPEAVQQDALRHAATLTRVELDDAGRARALYLAFLERWPDSDKSPAVHACLAVLYRQDLDQPAAAAAEWRRAAELAPEHADAGRWLLQAGRAYIDGGERALGDAALEQASTHTSTAAAAWLALGRVSLLDDPARAYEAYDAAERASTTQVETRLARLGRVTALERLERRESALAEVDEAIAEGDGDAALVRRQQRLRGAR